MSDEGDEIKVDEPFIHVGYRSERTIFDSGDLERAFAFAWLEMHQNRRGNDYLQALLGTSYMDAPNVTQRDAHVAATIVQWLGTNCGWSFVCEVLRKHGQYTIIDKKD